MRAFVALVFTVAASLAATAQASNGVLGVFFDRDGRACTGTVPVASAGVLHVVLLPSGSTFSGIHGAELRVESPPGAGFLMQGGTVDAGALLLGDVLGGGSTVAFPACRTGSAIPVLQFQALNLGAAANDVEVRVLARTTPSNPMLQCPLAVLCDEPYFTAVCVSGMTSILNPTGERPCAGGRTPADWARVKDLYR